MVAPRSQAVERLATKLRHTGGLADEQGRYLSLISESLFAQRVAPHRCRQATRTRRRLLAHATARASRPLARPHVSEHDPHHVGAREEDGQVRADRLLASGRRGQQPQIKRWHRVKI